MTETLKQAVLSEKRNLEALERGGKLGIAQRMQRKTARTIRGNLTPGSLSLFPCLSLTASPLCMVASPSQPSHAVALVLQLYSRLTRKERVTPPALFGKIPGFFVHWLLCFRLVIRWIPIPTAVAGWVGSCYGYAGVTCPPLGPRRNGPGCSY